MFFWINKNKDENLQDKKEIPNLVEIKDEKQADRLNYEEPTSDGKELDYIPNPEVVEIFKDFPEFYRERAIERYSKRKGFLRLDPVWYYYMNEERQAAMSGRYLEDERIKDMAAIQRAEQDYDKRAEEYKKNEHIFEENIKTKFGIPHQEGESFREKLLDMTVLTVCGVAMANNGFTYAKRNPYKPKWYGTVRRISGLTGCLCFAVVGVYYRFFDLGYFDLSKDKRHLVTRLEEDMVTTIPDKVLDYLGNKNGQNNEKDISKHRS